MTQEEKELLIKDLCERLPYGVKCCDFCYNDEGDIVNTIETLECIYPSIMEYKYKDVDAKHDIERIKPYLRPMSSMTEEEKKELKEATCPGGTGYFDEQYLICPMSHFSERIGYNFMSDILDWLNKYHFDYRGLIPMGLALEAPEDMYKDEKKV